MLFSEKIRNRNFCFHICHIFMPKLDCLQLLFTYRTLRRSRLRFVRHKFRSLRPCCSLSQHFKPFRGITECHPSLLWLLQTTPIIPSVGVTDLSSWRSGECWVNDQCDKPIEAKAKRVQWVTVHQGDIENERSWNTKWFPEQIWKSVHNEGYTWTS